MKVCVPLLKEENRFLKESDMAAKDEFASLLSPICIGGVELKNRIVQAPISNHMSTGAYSAREEAFSLARAKGGAGLIIIGATFVHLSGSSGEDLNLANDDNLPAFRVYNEKLHRYGAKSSIQLYHLGRYATGAWGIQPVAPSAIAWPPENVVPKALTVAEIKELVQAWGQAALRAKQAGFDMIEIHHAHGYLTSQFASLHANKRTDEYGGSFDNRTRFLREVVAACQAAVGEDFPIHVRLSNAEYVEDGLTIEDQAKTSQMLEKLGIAFISVSSGLSPCWGHTRTLPSMVHECGLNVADAAKIKAAVSIPVMVTGRLSDPYLAEDVLTSGQADLIGMARGLICDPEYVNKLADGRASEIRPCISCNNCHNRELSDRSTRCLYNVEAGRELELHITPAKRKKKILIAGGGPAGMEAARVAKLKGHDVILFEKSADLGGRLQLASVAPHKDEYATAVAFCVKELKRLNIDVRLNTELTRTVVTAENPDAVIVASGAKIKIPELKGLDASRTATAEQVLAGEVEVGQKIMVIGCGPVGAETAHYLAAKGKEVFIVEMLPQILSDMLPDFKWFLFEDFAKYEVATWCDTVVTGIAGTSVTLKSPQGEKVVDGVDSVVFAVGGGPNDALSVELKETGITVMVVGDAKAPRDGVNAFCEGYMAAYNL